ncbi:DUF3352 domain-containing protein [Sphaerospermopsis aphanizomenoides BCCUSP55]|uniref:DUF3352 domain-containing protein n=1 Tax=Sphaerospermopsis aphanizomenoides TaxID=459663 RepID=UPI0019060EF2|nr:DUF3352 domain-containing protein [Sphaerospermopsis aphanizomenoides]MBK1989969.1 DUF3352 domain-containing protein [Sphaerospermopsis aphanizomenoides BCCUSP55]
MNTQRSFFGFLVAGVIALLLIVIGGFYWFFGKSPVKFSTPTSQPGAAIFVSKLSPVMVSLLINPDQLPVRERQGQISQFKNSLLKKSNINYQDDIQPWLNNEVTLAVTSQDIDRDPENGLQPGYLMALATVEPEKSREFVEVLFSKRSLAGANLSVEEYKGVKLLYDNQEVTSPEKIQNPKSKIQNSLAGAVVDNFVLFANDIKVLREAINNVQAPDLNLSTASDYQQAIKELPKDSVAVGFLNLPMVAQWQGLELRESTYNSQIISLGLNSQGFLAESTFFSPSELTPVSAPLSQPVGALKYIPESSGLAIAGVNLNNLHDSDLAKLWQQGTATIYGSQEEAIFRWLKPLVDEQKRWDLNLTEDIFSWVIGEYAIALLPNPANTNLDWVFVVEKTPELASGIAKLDEIAKNKGFNVSSLTLNQQKVSAWTELTATTQNQAAVNVEAKIRGAHTTIDNYEIFASDLGTLEKILTHQEKSILDHPNFQDSIAIFPQSNQGYIYIDWKKSQEILERQLPVLKFVEVLAKPLFDNLRSLTVSNYSSELKTLKGGVFFQLDP